MPHSTFAHSCASLSPTHWQTLPVHWKPFAQVPQVSVRIWPQLSVAVTEPQLAPWRLQKLVRDSGVQAEHVPPTQVPFGHPRQSTVTDCPQLFVAVVVPHALSRKQSCASVSGTQLQVLVSPLHC